jgi:release factor glutamine methyltransferase
MRGRFLRRLSPAAKIIAPYDYDAGFGLMIQDTISLSSQSALDRAGRRHGSFRSALRKTIHFLSYHLILSRSRTQTTRAAGFRLTVPPTVFHPRFFISSECFARFIGGLDLTGKCVADIGTGSGILALAAARAGAEMVVAADINPNAALAAAGNARANGFARQVIPICSDLLSGIAPNPVFDVILSSPPKHAGEPRDLADSGWHAGAAYRHIADLFGQSRERLRPGGRMYVMVSSDSDLDLLGRLIAKAGFCARLAYEHSIYIESFLIYELVPEAQGAGPPSMHTIGA